MNQSVARTNCEQVRKDRFSGYDLELSPSESFTQILRNSRHMCLLVLGALVSKSFTSVSLTKLHKPPARTTRDGRTDGRTRPVRTTRDRRTDKKSFQKHVICVYICVHIYYLLLSYSFLKQNIFFIIFDYHVLLLFAMFCFMFCYVLLCFATVLSIGVTKPQAQGTLVCCSWFLRLEFCSCIFPAKTRQNIAKHSKT